MKSLRRFASRCEIRSKCVTGNYRSNLYRMSTITLGPARIGDAPAIAHMSRALIEPGLPWNWTPRRVATHMRQRDNMVITARDGRDREALLAGRQHVDRRRAERAVDVAGLAPEDPGVVEP